MSELLGDAMSVDINDHDKSISSASVGSTFQDVGASQKDGTLAKTADIVVAGGGHNSLIIRVGRTYRRRGNRPSCLSDRWWQAGAFGIERGNPHMVNGAPDGGDRRIAFVGGQRPVPGWSQHRMPTPGLYQTGGTTHPGGSITGAPGRNAAWILLEDLGHDPEQVMSLD